MDITALIGILMGVGILITALLLGQMPIESLFTPEALLVVFGGTITVMLISYSKRAIPLAKQGFKQTLSSGSIYGDRELIDYIIEVAEFVRREGPLALRQMLPQIDIPLLVKGLSWVMDNRSESFLREALSNEIEVAYREEMDCARFFESAGGFAPTMGIIGAVIGLVHVVGSFKDPQRLGQGVAGAFSATLYGVAFSNFFLLPIACKLKQQARDNCFQRTILLEGLTGILRREHPMILQEKLISFLNQSVLNHAGMQAGMRDDGEYGHKLVTAGITSGKMDARIINTGFLHTRPLRGSQHTLEIDHVLP